MRPNPFQPPPTGGAGGSSTPTEDQLRKIECFEFVREAMLRAIETPAHSVDENVNAEGLCRSLLELSIDQYGASGKDRLIAWGINTSEDLGVIAFQFIEVGIFRQSESDSIEQFKGLFDLSKSPETWPLKWD